MKRKPMDKKVRQAVIDRSGGICDLCGCHYTVATQHVHHRKLRSRGGDDSMANLVAVCWSCHFSIHQSPAQATAWGFMVASWDDPAKVPILRHRKTWQQPGDGWRPAQPITTTEGANQ